MIKTTIYLPESLKRDVVRVARQRSCSEAEVIRQAIEDAVARPKPRSGFLSSDELWGRNIDEYMKGFGER
ncbi:MAG: ribbon-helix-helix domain-containing protein [bacterium]|nr:ribbon-helix-helix domain-containing protein [bacterium]MDE0600425.1 ribbon-helix-helix domain-containing protein [bacterium]